jgi:predicted transcriptional regulator
MKLKEHFEMNEAQQNTETNDLTNETMVTLTADIVSAYAGSPNNQIDPSDLPSLISQVHSTLSGLGQSQQAEQVKQEPAVSIRSSVKPDYIVCLEDGRKLKMLKRHLRQAFGLSPDEYRAKWGLAHDYPMVAPNYAETRRKLAKEIGLGTSRTRSTEGRGRKAKNTDENTSTARKTKATKSSDAPKKRGRPKKVKEAA